MFFDGGNDTYIYQSGGDVLDVFVGGNNLLKFSELGGSGNDRVQIPNNVKLLIGNADTYFIENPDDTLLLVVGSTEVMKIVETPSADKIEFYTESQTKQFLVISEIYYPDGWVLKDDNNEYKIYNVNGILRGALIPPGKHNFTMSFNPIDVKIGRSISLSIFVLIVFILICLIIKKRNYGNI